MRGTHPRVTARPFLLHLKTSLMTGGFKNTLCQPKHFDILHQLSVFVWRFASVGHGIKVSEEKHLFFLFVYAEKKADAADSQSAFRDK